MRVWRSSGEGGQPIARVLWGRKAGWRKLEADGTAAVRHDRDVALGDACIDARFEEIALGGPFPPSDGKSKNGYDGNTEDDSSKRYGKIEKIVVVSCVGRRASMGAVDGVGRIPVLQDGHRGRGQDRARNTQGGAVERSYTSGSRLPRRLVVAYGRRSLVNHRRRRTLGLIRMLQSLSISRSFAQADFHWDNNITYRTCTFSSIGYPLRTRYESPILANAPLRTSARGSRIGWFISSILQQQSYDTMCGNCSSGVIPHSCSIVGVRPKVLTSFGSISSRIAGTRDQHTRTEYWRPARIHGDSVRLKDISAGSSRVLILGIASTTVSENTVEMTNQHEDSPILRLATPILCWVSRVADPVGLSWLYVRDATNIEQIVAHIDTPTEWCDTGSDNAVLVDCEDFLVLEDRKIVITDCGQLARRKPLVLE